jgi:AcrR family transcriptional regulator
MKQKRRLGRPPKADGHDRREKILRVALDLFSQQGFEATSIRQIAREVEISDPALYSHFKNKQEMLEDLFEMHGPKAVHSAIDSLDLEGAMKSPRKFAEDALGRLAERWFVPAENKFFRLMLIENLTGNIPETLTLETVQKPMRDRLTSLAHWLVKTGVAIKVNPEWMVLQFMAPITAIRTEIAMNPSRHTPHSVQRRLLNHLNQFIAVFLPRLK